MQQFFGDHSEWARLYISYYFDSSEPPLQNNLFPDDMREFMLYASKWSKIVAFPLSSIEEAHSTPHQDVQPMNTEQVDEFDSEYEYATYLLWRTYGEERANELIEDEALVQRVLRAYQAGQQAWQNRQISSAMSHFYEHIFPVAAVSNQSSMTLDVDQAAKEHHRTTRTIHSWVAGLEQVGLVRRVPSKQGATLYVVALGTVTPSA